MQSRGSLKLVVFLGNPGRQYERTRHNAGWLVLDAFPLATGLAWQTKFKGSWAKVGTGKLGSGAAAGGAAAGGAAAPGSVILLKPETMMNLSGESVQAAARFFRVEPGEILVVHDDVELPFGTVASRRGGGLAGHNGLKSIVNRIGSRDFWRLRIGVGRPAHGELRGHVLGRFSADEQAMLPAVLDAASELLSSLLETGPEESMRRAV